MQNRPEADESTAGDQPLAVDQDGARLAPLPAAVSLLFHLLDMCRVLMVETKSGSPSVQSATLSIFRDVLSRSDRAAVEKAVEACQKDLKERLDRERTALVAKFENGEVTKDRDVYPLPVEQSKAIIDLTFSKVFREVSTKHFEAFENDIAKYEYAAVLLRLSQADQKESLLGRALLPTVVAAFEEFIAAVLRFGMFQFPNALGELPPVPIAIIRRYQANISTQDLVRWSIDRRVNELLAESPTEWVKRIQGWTKIDITALGADWPFLMEALQRRHLVIHNNSRVDLDYLRKVDQKFTTGLAIGETLKCDQHYIETVLHEIEFFSTLLAMHWGAHFAHANPLEICPMALETVVRFEDFGLWSKAFALCDAILGAGEIEDADMAKVFRINWWFCNQQLGNENISIRREIEGFDVSDADPQVEAARAALLHDEEGLKNALRKLLGKQNSSTALKTLGRMPLFKRSMTEFPDVNLFINTGGGTRALSTTKRPGNSKRRRRQR